MKVWYTKPQIIMEIIAAVFLMAMFVFIFIAWNRLPELIPMHYDMNGVADRWGDRTVVLALPVIGTLLYFLFTGITVFPQIWNLPEPVNGGNKALTYRITRTMLILLKTEIIGSFFLVTVTSALTIPITVVFIPVLLALIVGTVGYGIIRIVRCSKKK
jgi:uncharacterized membrane protein